MMQCNYYIAYFHAGKSREVYNRVFTVIKEALQNIGLNMNPEHVMSDFDQALIQSVEINFPTTAHKGCFYIPFQAGNMEENTISGLARTV